MNAKKILGTILKIAIAAGIIFWMVKQDKFNVSQLGSFLVWEFLIVAILVTGINLFIVSERWRLLLSTQNTHPKPWELYKLSLIGIFFNFAMPGGVGGDVVKAFYFYKDHPQSKAIAVSSVFVDRLAGLYTIIIMALLAMTYDIQHVLSIETLKNLYYFFGFIFFVFTVGLCFLFSKNQKLNEIVLTVIQKMPLKEKLEKLYISGQLYGSEKKLLAKILGISFLSQSSVILLLYFIGRFSSFGEGVPISTYFLVTPIGFMATAIPISPAGVGVGQAAFYFLFNLYLGTQTELGPIVITVYQLLMLLFGLIGAYFYLVKNKKKDTLESIEIELVNSK
ncbi:MAG: flippase-like domain-containing protein [Bdellovibrionaceae bacterium]|nr:flippase-like domain-containing protein [Pseudobdellovibrionaceae bacterium]